MGICGKGEDVTTGGGSVAGVGGKGWVSVFVRTKEEKGGLLRQRDSSLRFAAFRMTCGRDGGGMAGVGGKGWVSVFVRTKEEKRGLLRQRDSSLRFAAFRMTCGRDGGGMTGVGGKGWVSVFVRTKEEKGGLLRQRDSSLRFAAFRMTCGRDGGGMTGRWVVRSGVGVPKSGGIVLNLVPWSGGARVPWRTLSRKCISGGTAEGPCRSGYS